MATSAEIAAAARGWLGTPFVHQGRRRGIGVDCAGVVIGVARELGLSQFDTRSYPAQPDPVQMRALLEAHLDPVAWTERRAGDILWFRVELDPQHLGLLVDAGEAPVMVHAFGRPGVMKVVETRVDAFWQERLAGCYRYRGVD